MKRKFLSLLLSLVFLFSAVPAAWAAEAPGGDVLPAASEPLLVKVSGIIEEPRDVLLIVEYDHGGININRAVVTTYLERRSTLGGWVRVDIGVTNNQWVDYSSLCIYETTYRATLPAAGTYRVISRFQFYNGRTLLDDIECSEEFTL